MTTKTHGHACRGKRTSTYQIWEGMKKRCNSLTCKAYKDYGGRGITICDRWLDYNNFLADMGVKPNGYSIERIDNNLGYCLENCKWIPRAEQAKNRRNIKFIEAFGKKQTIQEWSKETGLSYYTIYLRLRRGISNENSVKK
jgi:hypothetical protein